MHPRGLLRSLRAEYRPVFDDRVSECSVRNPPRCTRSHARTRYAQLSC
jgi:hypothetical protein